MSGTRKSREINNIISRSSEKLSNFRVPPLAILKKAAIPCQNFCEEKSQLLTKFAPILFYHFLSDTCHYIYRLQEAHERNI